MIERDLTRAAVLLDQGRYELAERELRRHLASHEDDAVARSLLAYGLWHLERNDEAEREARAAVAAMPDLAFAHYHLALVLDHRERLPEAVKAVEQALRLDPEDADYYALLASIRTQQRRWREALAAAEKGLALEPEHLGSANLRAMALTNLGRAGEAHEILDDALAQDPENDLTHANRGWTLLRQGKPREALDHFKEALRLDPSSEFARAGIVEALKGKNPLYRPILSFFLWAGSLSGQAQLALFLGLLFGVRALRRIAAASPALAPFLYPVIWAYTGFVLVTWLATPLFNLLLRLDPLGRMALSREEIRASNWLGADLALGLAALGTWWATGVREALLVAVATAGLALPLAGIFHCLRGWPRWAMVAYTAGFAALMALLTLACAVVQTQEEAAKAFSAGLGIAIGGAVLSTWIGAGLSAVTPRR
ncbi:MAG TPA: tetratricopeptide repeat protein [Thermoanaerobaculia bacterium]|nr:tetratricopeptide repeat protein [Thermoanaerobaculia bacterium]